MTTGIPHTVWLSDTRALMTAADLIETIQKKRSGKG